MQGVPVRRHPATGDGKPPRTSVYYHYYEYPAVHMVKRHYGIRTKRYKLIHYYYDIDAWELFDLERDPRELRNVIDDPAYASDPPDLKSELRRPAGCLRRFGGAGPGFAEKGPCPSPEKSNMMGSVRIKRRFD